MCDRPTRCFVGVLLAFRPVDSLQVDVTPARTSGKPYDPSRGRSDDVAVTGHLWAGRTCESVREGFEELLQTGFAVFDSEEAMFRASAPGATIDGAVAADAPAFSAAWLKTAREVNLMWASPSKTAPLGEFSKRLHAILAHEARGAFALVGEEYLCAITVGGPVTRGAQDKRPGASGNVYSLHQDPCFFSSLQARAAASEVSVDSYYEHVYPYGAVAHVAKQLDADASSGPTGNVTVIRQVNFWLPHERINSDKHLLLLSQAASAALGARDVAGGGVVAFKPPNGNRWLTRSGLRFVEHTLGPGHAFLINRPAMFVSANARDPAAAVFHCGAELENLGHCSTELRVAVCSRKPREKTEKPDGGAPLPLGTPFLLA